MQGMLYALGMERMLSPRREIPLPHAMTSFVETDDKERHTVLESNISLEIENRAGKILQSIERLNLRAIIASLASILDRLLRKIPHRHHAETSL
jgi:hypothetical protein